MGEDAKTKGPLLPDEAKSFSPFARMALVDAEDNQHYRWVVIFSSGILQLANSSSKSAWRAFSLMPMLERVRSVSGVEE